MKDNWILATAERLFASSASSPLAFLRQVVPFSCSWALCVLYLSFVSLSCLRLLAPPRFLLRLLNLSIPLDLYSSLFFLRLPSSFNLSPSFVSYLFLAFDLSSSPITSISSLRIFFSCLALFLYSVTYFVLSASSPASHSSPPLSPILQFPSPPSTMSPTSPTPPVS